MTNVDGSTTAITTFSTVKWWGRLWLPILFFAIRHLPSLTTALRELSFIHFARWTLITQLPHRKLERPHLFFESNFDGSWDEYIDAFSYKLTRGMRMFWGSSDGFPGPLPTGPFKAYIRANETVADHYWSAYPDASTTMIERALKITPPSKGQASAFMSMSPIAPDRVGSLRLYLQNMGEPLAKLPRTHMGRFVIVELEGVSYLLFTSNFDGDSATYLDELAALPEAYSIWGRCEGFDTPRAYLKASEIPTGLFYAPYANATVQEVQVALEALPATIAQWEGSVPVERIHIARATRIVTDDYDRTHPPAPFERDQHAHEYGTIGGRLVVDCEKVPVDMRYGILATSAVHDITARFSPNSSVPWPLCPPVGLGITSEHQDFLAGACMDRFFCGSAEDAVDLVSAQTQGRLRRYFWKRPRELAIFITTMRQQVTDLLVGTTYFSQVAIGCGPINVKYAIRMAGSASPRQWLKRPDLSARMFAHLSAGRARFTLHFQPQQPGESVDDVRQAWKGPWVCVAEGYFPAQEIGNGERLVITLGHCHPDHEAKGPISHLRISLYEAISRRRLAQG